MQKPVIQIVYATNNMYAPYAGVSIASLVEHASADYFYNICVFHTGLSATTKNCLNSMRGKNYKVETLAVDRFIEEEVKLMYTNFHFSKEMFYRILIPHIFPDCSKAIYLDCDTVVLGDISEFYNLDLEGHTIGAVNDLQHLVSRNYVTDELNLSLSGYINSGVLLIDCQRFRAQKIKEKCFRELAARTSLRYPDQDLINLVCAGDIKLFDRKWNYIWHYQITRDDPTLNLPQEEMDPYLRAAGDIGILHFTSNIKPWNNRICPLAEHFWDYVPRSPFAERIISAWNRIRQRYVTYKFIEFDADGVKLTASLQSLDGKDNRVTIRANGKELPAEQTYEHLANISKHIYRRTFFEFHIPYTALTEAVNVTVHDYASGEALETLSSATFPIDFATNSFYSNDQYIIYSRDGALCFEPFNKAALARQRAVFKDALKLAWPLRHNKNKLKLKARCLRFLHKVAKPFFKKEIWFISDRVDAAGDNGQALFEHLVSNPADNVKVYFVIDKKSKDYKTVKKIGPVISPYSKLFKFLTLFATKNISSQLDPPVMEPIYCEQYLRDILFKCKVVFLQHGITKDDLSLVYSRYRKHLDLFVTAASAEYESIVFNPAYGCGERVTKLVGLARYDKLVDEKEKIIFIAPTWRKNCVQDMHTGELDGSFAQSNYFLFYNALLHDEQLIRTAQANGYKLCFYQHHIMRQAYECFGRLDDVFVDPSQFTYNDMFRKGALLLTDFSSTQFDFAYLYKPVIYCHFDKDEFFSSHTYRKGYYDYERDGFGEVLYDKDSTAKAIIEYIETGCSMKDKYRQRVDVFFAYHDQNNCKRTVEEILKL